MKTEYNHTIEKAYEKLKKLQKERNRLEAKLERSLTLQKLCPNVFSHGSVESWISGNASKGFFLTIVKGNGEKVRFNIKEIPFENILPHEQFLKDCLDNRYGFNWKNWVKERKGA